MRKTCIMIMLSIFVFCAAGCETFKGLGKDIENTGNNIQEILSGGV